jgi:RNA polymerase sigma-70 factor (ECF subfamily)
MEDMIEKWQEGDISAFEFLFRQYKGLIYKNALLLTDNREDAEDVLQEVFISAWKARRQYDSKKGSAATWLRKITINLCLNRRQKREVTTTLDGEDVDNITAGSETPLEEGLIIKDEYAKMLEAIRNLDDKHRAVIILRYFNDLSYKEIADLLSIPLGTVRSRIYTALTLIKDTAKISYNDTETIENKL